MASQAVINARSRRAASSANVQVDTRWFIEEVSKRTDLSMKQRMLVAVSYLQDRIVQNISKPVMKTVVHGRTIVTDRSKPGEFPRADTTYLMKSIFHDVDAQPGLVNGYVGTPVDYGVILELRRMRSFLLRTLNEEKANIVKIVGGTPIG